MNNDQFRRLMLANSAKKEPQTGDDGPKTKQPTNHVSLGSRQKASIPMTPRSVGGQSSFARQLAERQNEHSQKKFKTSAPRGSKLASGYTDRSKDREDAGDDRAARLKQLEQSLKDEEIDRATYDRMRQEIAGGDLESTHLVKGLDFKLLERVRRGEDVYSNNTEDQSSHADEEEPDLDDEFDKLEGAEVQALEKEKAEKKKGQLSTVAPATSKKRTRDQLLAELRASREAAKAKAEPALGDRFKKIGGKHAPGSRIERDSKGREVLIIVDEDGHEKRKVRKVQPGADKAEEIMLDLTAKPLGMEVPEQYRKQAVEDKEDSDVDIFDDVGDDYDPLAGMDGSDSDSDEEADEKPPKDESKAHSMAPPPKPQSTSSAAASATKQNYFQNSKSGLLSEEASKAPSMSDPAIMAAIKRASALRPIGDDKGNGSSDEEEDESARKEKEMKARHKKMLENADRDAEDMDMGFGTSRYEDEEDFDDQKIKLSNWGGEGDDGEGGGSKGKRKRGPKKRKGDANSAADVLRVMEERKKQ